MQILQELLVRVSNIAESHMEDLYYPNPPCLCLITDYHSTATPSAPLRAPKRAQKHSKHPPFPVSML